MKKFTAFLLLALITCTFFALNAVAEAELYKAIAVDDVTLTDTINGKNSVGTVSDGESVIAVAKDNYCLVIATDKDGNEIQGYCDASDIAILYSGVVTTRLNVRSNPSTSGDVVGIFEEDAQITIIGGLNGNWYAVKGNDGNGNPVSGYCHGKYINNVGAIKAEYNGEIKLQAPVLENGEAKQVLPAGEAVAENNTVFNWVILHWPIVAAAAVALIVVIVIICKVKGSKSYSSYSRSTGSSYTPSYSGASSGSGYSSSSSSSSYSGDSGYSSSYIPFTGSSDINYCKDKLQVPYLEARDNLKIMLNSNYLTYEQKQELVRYHNNHHLDAVRWDGVSGYSNIYDSGYSSSTDTTSCGCSTGGASCGCGIDGGGGGGSTSCGCGADDGGSSCGCGADTSCGGCGASCGCGAE